MRLKASLKKPLNNKKIHIPRFTTVIFTTVILTPGEHLAQRPLFNTAL